MLAVVNRFRLSRSCSGFLNRSLARMNSFREYKRLSSFVADNRGYVRVSGTDIKKFLQGICTIEVNRLGHDNQCRSGLFLTSKGRILTDAIMYEVPNKESTDNTDIIIETSKDSVDMLSKQLKLYRMRSKIGIDFEPNVSTLLSRTHQCSNVNVSDDVSLSVGVGVGVGVVASEQNVILCRAPDPRISGEFLDRMLVNLSPDAASEYVKNGDTITITSADADGSGSGSGSGEIAAAWYTNIRIINGLSEGPECSGKIPLEYNFDLLHSIDFNKGCYVGQELTARTKHQGLVRKRVVPFVLDESYLCTGTGAEGSAVFPMLSDDATETLLESGYKDPLKSSATLSLEGYKICTQKGSGDELVSVGEIIRMNANSSVGICMFRVGHLLNPTNRFFVQLEDNGPLKPVFPFRPKWWPEKDPVTDKPVISSN